MKKLALIQSDPWLEPYADAINGRYHYALATEKALVGHNKHLSEFASGYLYFGLHATDKGWVFREWAPNATAIYLIGDFNAWEKTEEYRLKPIDNGNWEINLEQNALKHGQLYKLWVEWNGGAGERIPAWCQRVV